MESNLVKRQKDREAVAIEFATHADFAEARADSLLWDATSLDGLYRVNVESFVPPNLPG